MAIPNILWQSWKTKDIPEVIKPQALSWTTSNPQLDLKFMDDRACANFILENFGDEVLSAYLSLPQNIMRADFWRIAVVYIHGGYYADLDVEANVNLSQLIENINSIECVFITESNNIANFFFGATPNHPVMKMTLDIMLDAATYVNESTSQNFGMHPFHVAVREYFNIQDTNYQSNNTVHFLNNEQLKGSGQLVHMAVSGSDQLDNYESWRARERFMLEEREKSNDVLFFTTFNENGYNLYGKEWVNSFIRTANYYNKFRAKIYYQGFVPDIIHPLVEWIKYEKAIPAHAKWKKSYLAKSQHSEYIKTMTVRFSHKAFVIQHALDAYTNDYVIWLDGDCVFKNSDYSKFPTDIFTDEFLACQVEENHDLNHIESGILIFRRQHFNTKIFNREFKKWYKVKHILEMSQPYDGFVVAKSLLTAKLKYFNLNQTYGVGGIQSDPSMTFRHPKIAARFIHNIGWTGKNQYSNWDDIFKKDSVYKLMNSALFGQSNTAEMLTKKKAAKDKMAKLKQLKVGNK